MAKSSESTSRTDKFSKQVKATIEQLRLSLLDLTARNPLISMQFAARSNSQIRVVDELPDMLFYKLTNRQTMDFVALPSFDEDSKDELVPQFLEAFSSALLTDEEYAKSAAKLDGDDDSYDEKLRKLQRELKDRVRERLGMPKRILRKQESLAQHARNNGIEPSFDLPLPVESAADGRHQDDSIQTLLPRPDLERRLNGLISKAKTFEQETGISVMRMAFGFLEWKDPARSDGKNYLSPLVLLPVAITVRKSAEGPVYRVDGTGDDPEVNLVLAEKLRQEFGIEFPQFDAGSVEQYFEQLGEIKHKKLSWTVRRQVVLGVFPSSRMAMYEDLDTSKTDFSANEIVESVIVGSGSAGSGALAEEYDVDNPAVEAEVPILVKKADQSQFSVLVDLARGKTFAVQGPPGTGKSETIVNAIAAAIGAGKKVLFVAEKAAALKVVNARLVEIGLGEFALPLLAGRTSRDEFMKSIRARIPLRDKKPRDLDANIARFRDARGALAEYIEILSTDWDRTGKTVHTVLGSSIATAEVLKNFPKALLLAPGLPDGEHTEDEISEVAAILDRFEAAYREMEESPSHWRGTSCLNSTPRKLDSILFRAGEAAKAAHAKLEAKGALNQFGIRADVSDEELIQANETLAMIAGIVDFATIANHANWFDKTMLDKLRIFFDECAATKTLHERLRSVFHDPSVSSLTIDIQNVEILFRQIDSPKLEPSDLHNRIAEKANRAKTANYIKSQVERFASYWPSASNWSLADIAAAGKLAQDYRDILPLRSDALINADGRSVLKSLIQKAEELRDRKYEFSERFHNSALRLRFECENAARVLGKAGRLSILSGAYREAKAFYLKHAKVNSFDAEVASYNLQTAGACLADIEEFDDLARKTGVFGAAFLGLDTDFRPFNELSAFYDTVEKQFSHIDQREIRSFLKTADTDYISSLPSLPTNGLPGRVADVVSLGERLEAEVAELEAALAKINPLIAHFMDPPGTPMSQLPQLAGQVGDFQKLSSRLDYFEHGTEFFGSEFCGWNTPLGNWKALLAASEVVNQRGPSGDHLRRVIENGDIRAFADALATVVGAIAEQEQKILEVTAEASHNLADELENAGDAKAYDVLGTAAEDRNGLVRSIALASLYAQVREKGVLPTVEKVIQQSAKVLNLGKTITALLYRSSAERVYDYFGGELRHYSGVRIEDLRSQMKDADAKIIELSRSLLRANLIDAARPPQGVARGRVSEFTERALLDYLSDLRKISVPVRDIIRRSFRAIQELKPCWMMSPLAIAQYVPKDGVGFDLCIIDEASQMPPADAIGALYRCRQAMVVGDSKQLPPTSFFQQFLDDTIAVDDDADPVTEESILEKTASAFRPSRVLRWHYRSRHSGLIRFSNKIMYQDDLVVFPSSEEDRPDMGVQLVETRGLYKSNMNEIEAKVVVDAALRFMKDEPDRSLGIVAVNQKQADHIRQQLDFEIPRSAHASRYVEKWSKHREGLEEFFVKNLENVQGDERDVIFISTVYGPSSIGQKAMQRFGPINGEGGKRRLNVLFTRAKQNIRTFTSLSGADITATEHSNAGAWMLKRWLEYSAGMQFDVANDEAGGAFDSPFEEHVADVIKGMGYTAISQVGSAGFWIDIGVRHPDWPFGFILGVECDGAAYHSSKSARDRDHYRQAILEGLGWSIHRIWSTDWYQDSEQEKRRLQNAISGRLAELKNQGTRRPEPTAAISSASDMGSHANISVADVPITKPIAAQSSFKQESFPLLQEIQVEPAAKAAMTANSASLSKEKKNTFVEIGDTVRIRYLDKEADIFQFKIVFEPSAPEKGVVNRSAPLAKAVLENEEGDTLEILQGSRIRQAVLEMVKKPERAATRL